MKSVGMDLKVLRREGDYESIKRSEDRQMARTISVYGLARQKKKINKKRFCNEKGSGGMVKKFPDDKIVRLQYEV